MNTLNLHDQVVNSPNPCKSGVKYYFCVGMRRGGSTLQTQLVKSLLGDTQPHLVTPETIESFLKSHADTSGPIIIKAHKFLPQAVDLLKSGQARVFYVYRDIRDVVASIVKKYNIPQFSFVHGGTAALLEEFNQWTSVPGLYMAQYETMIADVAGECQRLAGHLGVTLSADDASAISRKYSVNNASTGISDAAHNKDLVDSGQNSYDRSTLLHPNHIQTGGSGGFRTILDSQVLAAIEWQAGGWLNKHGYQLETPPWMRLAAHLYFHTKAALHHARHLGTSTAVSNSRKAIEANLPTEE